jgi:cardiolipin synthase
MLAFLKNLWPHLTAGLVFLIALLAACHAILYKKDSRSAAAWVGIIWFFPLGGVILYWIFGINRIKRKASILRSQILSAYHSEHQKPLTSLEMKNLLPENAKHLFMLDRVVSHITHQPLLSGNEVNPLRNGDEAYPFMIEAIDRAHTSVSLATFVFANDSIGNLFVDALVKAVRRGIEVRVLIDGVGSRYSFPPITRQLKKAGINVKIFMPTSIPWYAKYVNLRNHRKILVIDGEAGFTGGMNIREECSMKQNPEYPIQDMHFFIKGPVVRHLQETFAEDWFFSCKESLTGQKWFPELFEQGSVTARGIIDGPDEDIDKTSNVMLGAIACARKSICIMTPYFLPNSSLVSALNTASMRGVQVNILLPEKNNYRIIGWATNAQLWHILKEGCRVWLAPPPFDHSKLMLVDDIWSLIGSANWDQRSLRLNFEFNVECYCEALAKKLNEIFEEKRKNARPITLGDMENRPLPVRIRDGTARLFMPYL